MSDEETLLIERLIDAYEANIMTLQFASAFIENAQDRKESDELVADIRTEIIRLQQELVSKKREKETNS